MRIRSLLTLAIFAAGLCASLPAQIKVHVGRQKPVTMKDMEQGLDPRPTFIDKELLAKVHTVAILTVAGPPKVTLGIKSTDGAPLLAQAETQLLAKLTAAGFTVQPLAKTREIASKEYLSAYIDSMPDSERERLQNLSPEEKEAYVKENAQKLCDNRMTRILFGCPGQEESGESSEGGGGNKAAQSSPNTLFLRAMTVGNFTGAIQAHDSLGEGGQALGPVSRRVAGELAEKLGVDAVVILTTTSYIERPASANRLNVGRDFAVERVRMQVINSDAQFAFADCIREMNPKALPKKTFALNYDADMMLERFGDLLGQGIGAVVGHFAGKAVVEK